MIFPPTTSHAPHPRAFTVWRTRDTERFPARFVLRVVTDCRYQTTVTYRTWRQSDGPYGPARSCTLEQWLRWARTRGAREAKS